MVMAVGVNMPHLGQGEGVVSCGFRIRAVATRRGAEVGTVWQLLFVRHDCGYGARLLHYQINGVQGVRYGDLG
jgi:hypothetical protein